jgi:hypothetical protein
MTTTDADNDRKRTIILKCIRDGLTPDRAIAERAGCGITTVRRVRAEIEGRPQIDKRREKQ